MPRKKKLIRRYVNVEFREGYPPVTRWVQGYTEREIEQEKENKKLEYRIQLGQLLPAAAPQPVTPSPAPVETFKSYAETWYRLFKKPRVRQTTRCMYENILNAHLYPKIGSKPLDQITTRELQSMMITDYEGKSKSLIDKVMLVMRQVFDAAVGDELIVKNPVDRVKPPDGTQSERMPLALEMVEQTAAKLLRHRDGLLALLMMYTGMRRGEVLALRWEHISDNKIHVKENATFIGNKTYLGAPKTKAGIRTIPLVPILLHKLDKPGKPEEFIIGKDKPYTQAAFKRAWERLQRDIPELANITPHQLRHTYTMLLRRAGVEPATIQYLLGHEDYSTTANIYTHIDINDTNEASKKLAEYLSRPSSTPTVTSLSSAEEKVASPSASLLLVT